MKNSKFYQKHSVSSEFTLDCIIGINYWKEIVNLWHQKYFLLILTDMVKHVYVCISVNVNTVLCETLHTWNNILW